MKAHQSEKESSSSVHSDAARQSGNGKSLPAVPVLQSKPIAQKLAEKEEEQEEMPLQGKFAPQLRSKEEEEKSLPLQEKFNAQPFQTKENKTGLPDKLKTGVEDLSGITMDDVQVHYNSGKPAQLNALAYAQGTDIHVGPGQEKHVPHEAWHIVQQKQGRVQPTTQLKEGVLVNDDKGLEYEADVMGGRALGAIQKYKDEHVGMLELTPSTNPLRLLGMPTAQLTVNPETNINLVKKALKQDREAHTLFSHWIDDASNIHDIGNVPATVAQILAFVTRWKMLVEGFKLAKGVFTQKMQAHDGLELRGVHDPLLTRTLAEAIRPVQSVEGLLNPLPHDERVLVDVATKLQSLNSLLADAAHLLNGHDPSDAQPPEVVGPQLNPQRGNWDIHEDINRLVGLKNQLDSPELKTVKKAIKTLRDKDDEEPRIGGPPLSGPDTRPLKGAILYRFIKDSRQAILNLVHQLDDSVAIFSLERGGSFLADLMMQLGAAGLGGVIPNVKVAKRESIPGINKTKDELQQIALVAKMMETEEGTMFQHMRRDPALMMHAPRITMALAETAVSGSSVNQLLKTINEYHTLLPYTVFNVLAEKQTIKDPSLDRSKRGGMRLTDPGIRLDNLKGASIEKVKLFVSHVEYILGEDVGYQISYNNQLAGQPLLVFDETANRLIAAKLTAGGMLPRDLLKMLIGGSFDRALSEIFG